MNLRVAGLFPQGPYVSPAGEKEFLEPFGLERILGVAQAKGCQVGLFSLYDCDVEECLRRIVSFKPDILAISAMTPQINLALEMAEKAKKTLSDVFIVLGGYHATFDPLLARLPFVDACILGEGEETFAELLECICEKKSFDNVLGLSYKKNSSVKVNLRRPRIRDLSKVPPAFRPTFIRELRNYSLTFPAPSQQTGVVCETFSVGCPFSCTFCTNASFYGSQAVYEDAGSVVSRVQKDVEQFGVNSLFFTDLEFTANSSKVFELCDALIESGLSEKIFWECLSNISTARDKKLLEKMHEAGCRKIGWGIESLSQNVLDSYHKPLKFSFCQEVLQNSSDVGILNSGFYMIGSSLESLKDFLQYPSLLAKLAIDRLRVSLLTPLPGSVDFVEMKRMGLLLHENWKLYDTCHLVWKHPSISSAELEKAATDLTERFYLEPAYEERVWKNIARFPELHLSYAEFFQSISSEYPSLKPLADRFRAPF
ncbi:MAG: radical SAM protein [Candidatus Diapherotrites archaeon]